MSAHPTSPARNREPLVLGIETSCDETGVGIVRGQTLLTNVVASSMSLHVPYGGVIPEIAARAHLEALVPSVQEALRQAGVSLADLDAIAVTSGPGLAGALMVGVAGAKALALAANKPLYALNHLVAHVAVALLDSDGDAAVAGPAASPASGAGLRALPENLGAVLVSGGHTEILKVDSLDPHEGAGPGDPASGAGVTLLGSTIDDAAGEAYDKVARILGLSYPGGPVIDALAQTGAAGAFKFPRALTLPKFMGTSEAPGKHRYDFSFSGLKTATLRCVQQFNDAGLPVPQADIAASFQEAVADVVSMKAVLAAQEHGLKTMLLGGGVAANSRIRGLLQERLAQIGVRLIAPPLSLCTDNGAMVAALGAYLVAAGVAPSSLEFSPNPSQPVTQIKI